MGKRKNQEVEDVVPEISEEEQKRLRKEEKKRLKKEKKEKESTVDEDDTTAEDADKEEKRRLKKEKKAKKAVASEEGASSSTVVATASAGDTAAFRKEQGIKVYPEEDSEKYAPLLSFEALYPTLTGSCNNCVNYIKDKKFASPSPIQAQCWPPLLDKRDVIGIAATGSGKTLAFLVPALKFLQEQKKNLKKKGLPGRSKKSPGILVLAPTRELAMQSQQVVTEIGGDMHGICIYGGVSKQAQIQELKRSVGGVDVVVATPGRLLDLVQEGNLSLADVSYLVLDEADRMLDEGFEPAIRQIVGQCPPAGLGSRQTVMFSATWPEEIRTLAERFLSKDVVRVVVGGEDLAANHRVTQIVECVEGGPYVKEKKLVGLLDKYHKSRKNRCLIFVLYKKEAVALTTVLANKGYNCGSIHGDKNQYDRSAALAQFKSGEVPLLIATDVAARGLDIPNVEYVLNYSFPLTVEDYVHRIGRTGRGGASGVSHTFFTDFDKGLAGALVGVLQEANQEVPQEIFKYQMVTKKKTSKLYGDFGPKADISGKKATKITFD